MTASLADSLLYRRLFGDEESAALFSEETEIRSMLRVEGALARVQGRLGIIPYEAGVFIDEASRRVVIDPALLAEETAVNGVPVPGLVAAFIKAMGNARHAQYLHWGATSQDIIDTALALRLLSLMAIWEKRLGNILSGLARLALVHADLRMVARTYGQAATPTSFGAIAAGWGRPLERYRARLDGVRREIAVVSLGGAAGTLSAMGPEGPAVRAALAKDLGLSDPQASWHAERDRIGLFASWMVGLCTSLAKVGEDLILMAQSGIGEMRLAGTGGSSTMPQKQNPVEPSVLVALARQAGALASSLQQAGIHRQQRDGAAWFVEWLTLPQLCISTGRVLSLAVDLSGQIAPDARMMTRA